MIQDFLGLNFMSFRQSALLRLQYGIITMLTLQGCCKDSIMICTLHAPEALLRYKMLLRKFSKAFFYVSEHWACTLVLYYRDSITLCSCCCCCCLKQCIDYMYVVHV